MEKNIFVLRTIRGELDIWKRDRSALYTTGRNIKDEQTIELIHRYVGTNLNLIAIGVHHGLNQLDKKPSILRIHRIDFIQHQRAYSSDLAFHYYHVGEIENYTNKSLLEELELNYVTDLVNVISHQKIPHDLKITKVKKVMTDPSVKDAPTSIHEKTITNINDIDFRKQFEAEHQCDDGHYVRSKAEMLIDNWLYSNRIVHAYEKSVFMPHNPEEIVISDFYLPEGDVYIEFWGNENDPKYLSRKETKQKLYKNNSINLIELNDSHIKRLNDILPRLLHKYMPSKKF